MQYTKIPRCPDVIGINGSKSSTDFAPAVRSLFHMLSLVRSRHQGRSRRVPAIKARRHRVLAVANSEPAPPTSLLQVPDVYIYS